MGLRIVKMMGYGLTDVKSSKEVIADPRINSNSVLLNWNDSNVPKRWQVINYRKWLIEKSEDKDVIVKAEYLIESNWIKDHNGDINRCLIWKPECNKKILCLMPMSSTDQWFRYDDPIDYYEENGTPRNKVKILPHGIFPYTGFFIHKQTKQAIESQLASAYFRLEKNLKKERLLFAKLMKFESLQDCEDNLISDIPNPLKMLCEYTRLFNDPDTVYQLKPMIYTYWC